MSTDAKPLTQLVKTRTSDKPRTLWDEAGRRLKRNRVFLASSAILLVYIFIAAFAPLVAPYDYAEQFRKDGLTVNGSPVRPNAKFIMGTDQLGRDMWSRIVFGARSAIFVGLCVSIFSVLIGVLYGGLSGLLGGIADNFMMRIVDILLSLPQFLLIMMFVAIFERSLWITILVMSVLGWTTAARIFRSEVVSVKEREFVLAETSMGASKAYIFFRHILPQLMPLMIISIGLGIPGAIFMEASLSYLGLGVPPPWPTWGGMISVGMGIFRNAWWLLVYPGIALVLLVVVLNLIADSLRQALDPHLRGR